MDEQQYLTNSIDRIPLKKQIITPVDVTKQNRMVFSTPLGSRDVSYRSIQASTYNSGSVLFSYQCPSLNVGLSRIWFVKYNASFTVTLAPGAVEFDPQTPNAIEGLSAFPVNSCTQSLTLSINGANFPVSQYDSLHAMLSMFKNNQFGHRVPCAKDKFQEYLTPAGTPSQQSPFLAYHQYDNDAVYNTSRNFLNYNITPLTVPPAPVPPSLNRVQTYTIEWVEPVLNLSPLLTEDVDCEKLCMFGVRNLQLNLSLANLNRRAFSSPVIQTQVAAPDRFSDFQFTSAPTLQLTFMSLPDAALSLPPIISYPYVSQTKVSSTASALINPNGTQTMLVQNIALGSMPRRLILYALDPNSLTGAGQTIRPQTFSRIEGINLTLGSTSNLYADCSTDQLYKISVKNGLKSSYQEWAGLNGYTPTETLATYYSGRGSVVILDLCEDQSIPSSVSDSVLAQVSIQVSVNIRNISNTAASYVCYALALNSGIASYDSATGYYNVSQGVVDSATFVACPIENEDYEPEHGFYQGGSFFGKLWSGIKKIAPVVGKIVSTIAPTVGTVARQIGLNKVADIADTVGRVANKVNNYMQPQENSGSGLESGGRMAAGRMTAGRRTKASGGRVLSRSQVRH